MAVGAGGKYCAQGRLVDGLEALRDTEAAYQVMQTAITEGRTATLTPQGRLIHTAAGCLLG
jgi:hypothetical protein